MCKTCLTNIQLIESNNVKQIEKHIEVTWGNISYGASYSDGAI
jgi:hypothetical protein